MLQWICCVEILLGPITLGIFPLKILTKYIFRIETSLHQITKNTPLSVDMNICCLTETCVSATPATPPSSPCPSHMNLSNIRHTYVQCSCLWGCFQRRSWVGAGGHALQFFKRKSAIFRNHRLKSCRNRRFRHQSKLQTISMAVINYNSYI